MIIALVTEFGQDKYFQWRMAWSEEQQRKYGVFVKSVKIQPEHLKIFPPNHRYWEWIRKADFVFVYCSRSEKLLSEGKTWLWYELPLHARKVMRPEARMIAQWDQEFIWVFHPHWSWWRDKIPTQSPPEQFFKESQILEQADAHATVLEYPLFQKYTNTPSYYLPLPQLARWSHNLPYNASQKRIALLNHTSLTGSITHTSVNVAKRIKLPVTVFNSLSFHKPYSGKIFCTQHSLPQGSISFGRLNRQPYMDTLNKCYVAIDDPENYIGWSRFVMECALAHVPCIGSNFANKIFFPDLYVAHKDYAHQRKLIKQLINNPAWHKQITEKAFKIVFEHMDTDRLCTRLLTIAKELGSPNTPIDIEKNLCLDFISKKLPNSVPPLRPKSGSVFDQISGQSLTPETWDKQYGRWSRFLAEEQPRKNTIRTAMEWMKNKWVTI
jgi:hypothetical protein